MSDAPKKPRSAAQIEAFERMRANKAAKRAAEKAAEAAAPAPKAPAAEPPKPPTPPTPAPETPKPLAAPTPAPEMPKPPIASAAAGGQTFPDLLDGLDRHVQVERRKLRAAAAPTPAADDAPPAGVDLDELDDWEDDTNFNPNPDPRQGGAPLDPESWRLLGKLHAASIGLIGAPEISAEEREIFSEAWLLWAKQRNWGVAPGWLMLLLQTCSSAARRIVPHWQKYKAEAAKRLEERRAKEEAERADGNAGGPGREPEAQESARAVRGGAGNGQDHVGGQPGAAAPEGATPKAWVPAHLRPR